MGVTTALNIANYLYSKGIKDSNLKIQKLVYISFGFYSHLTREHLFDDEIQAWQYGPVVPNVYSQFENLNGIYNFPKDKANIIKKHVDRVINLYGKKAPWHLVDLTHKKGTPWDKVEFDKQEIKKEDIIEYYRILLQSSIHLLSKKSRTILKDFAGR